MDNMNMNDGHNMGWDAVTTFVLVGAAVNKHLEQT
jgi:hypothetical protein